MSYYRKRDLVHQGTLEERLSLLTGYAQAAHVPEPMYACPCWDLGWVPVENAYNTWKPCERCEPERHARWIEGGYAPNGRRLVKPTETPVERNRRDLL